MNWRSPFVLWVSMVILTMLTTFFVKVPLPTKGYFNFGDIAVVFSGLAFAQYAKTNTKWAGGLAAGFGSAIADVISGYGLFAPVTFLAKGLEGIIAGTAARVSGPLRYGLLLLGGAVMVGVYFAAEWMFIAYGGPVAAMTELGPNTIQAVGGMVGGYILFKIFAVVVTQEEM